MKIDIEELKRLAEAATPGPWIHAVDLGQVGSVEDNHGSVIAQAQQIIPADYEHRNRNAAYIAAANPATVLELIRQRDAALGGLGLFMDAVDRPPERNCSCHISPPCNDCVENSGLREAFEYAEEIIANAEKQS